MRRNLFIFTLLLLCGVPVSLWAQSSQTNKSLERAISLYNLGHWIEARTEFKDLRAELSSVHDRFHIEKIEYYVALCDSQLKMRDAEGRMKRYLAEYGGSAYANDVQFALGAYYCMVGDDEKAAAELAKTDYRTLSPAQKDQYDLRMGYMAFMKGDYVDAERYFSRIVPTSDYADHATYYKSYMAYSRGEFDVARNGFSALTSSAIYRDLMPYYLMQIDFKSGDYRAVVNSGDALMQNTTEEQAVQIRRMMAESWFQLDDYAGAVKYMNAYKASGGEMGRLENYIMGYSL